MQPAALLPDIEALCARFPLNGRLTGVVRHGTGHIHDTFALTYDQAGMRVRYILQRINRRVFRNVPELMDNISRILRFIATRNAGHSDSSRRCLTLVHALDGSPFALDAAGEYWRVYLLIERAATYDVVTTPQQAHAAGHAFGRFQTQVAGLPAPRLHEIIPGFHDTPRRYVALQAAITADRAGRAASVAEEIAFAQERSGIAGAMVELHRSGAIPERITHNDTKANNVLLDVDTGEGICVIDLDTVMPGLAPYDFGDLIRSAANSATEDTQDASGVRLVMPVYEAALRGYLGSAGELLNPSEITALPLAAKVMTFEQGIRFLTDYLDGDVYYRTARPHQNLDRCRCQFALLRSMETHASEMEALAAPFAE